MTDITRRDALKIGAGTAALAATGVDALAQGAPKWEVTPEKGASIRVLRGARFVQGDETVFNQNVAKYEKATGVKVGKTSRPRPLWPPRSARDPILSMAGTTSPTNIRTS
jgi:hypothetical protein